MTVIYSVIETPDHMDLHRPLRLCVGEYWVELRANPDQSYTVEWTGGAPGFSTYSSLSMARRHFAEQVEEDVDCEFNNAVMPWEANNA